MKKSILVTILCGVLIFAGQNVFAQASKNIAENIETATTSAIVTIKKNKTLSEADQQKFIERLKIISDAAKTKNDNEAEKVFKDEYQRLADNYKRITHKELPLFVIAKKD